MAKGESIVARAERVLVGLTTVEMMCRAARLQTQFGVVEVSAFSAEVSVVVEAVVEDAVAVTTALRASRVVRFRVIE